MRAVPCNSDHYQISWYSYSTKFFTLTIHVFPSAFSKAWIWVWCQSNGHQLSVVLYVSCTTTRLLTYPFRILTSQSLIVLTAWPSMGTWVKAWTPFSPGLATVTLPMESILTACSMNWSMYFPPPLDSRVTTMTGKVNQCLWYGISLRFL